MKTNIKSSISYFENNFFNIIPIDDVMNIKKETEETSFITDDDEKLPQLINIYNELKEKYLSLNIDITRKLFRKIILDNGQNNLTFVSIVRGGMPILYCFDKWCKKENIRAQFINMSLRGDIKYINNILSKIKNRSAGKIIFLDGCVSTGNTFWYLKKFLDLNKLNYSYLKAFKADICLALLDGYQPVTIPTKKETNKIKTVKNHGIVVTVIIP